jgi:uncharacterized LabA/DUF88 family protein
MQRVIVYIDGYNLYYGMREAYGRKYSWLDLQAFVHSFLKPGMELVKVKYFTAIITSSPDSRSRQELYLRALESHCDKLEIHYGRFLAKTKMCRNCGTSYPLFEEKETDVKIACQLLNDTHLDTYDCAYVVSGDSDLVPPLAIVKKHHPSKHIIVAHPPRRKSEHLCRTADGWFAISRGKFSHNQLPYEIALESGGKIVRPAKWH